MPQAPAPAQASGSMLPPPLPPARAPQDKNKPFYINFYLNIDHNDHWSLVYTDNKREHWEWVTLLINQWDRFQSVRLAADYTPHETLCYLGGSWSDLLSKIPPSSVAGDWKAESTHDYVKMLWYKLYWFDVIDKENYQYGLSAMEDVPVLREES